MNQYRSTLGYMFLIFSSCFNIVSELNAQTQTSPIPQNSEFSQFKSFLEATYLNCEEVEKGDVLVEESFFFERCLPDGKEKDDEPITLSRTVLTRASFDFVNQMAAMRRIQRDLIATFDEKETIRTDMQGVIADPKLVTRYFFPDSKNEQSEKQRRDSFDANQADFLREVGFPDYRTLFLFEGRPISLSAQLDILGRKKKELFSNFRSASATEWEAVEKIVKKNEVVNRAYRFEKSSGMICKYKVVYQRNSDGAETTGGDWSIKWKELNGLFVPSTGRKLSVIQLDLPNGSREMFALSLIHI